MDSGVFLDVFTEGAATRDSEKLEVTPVTHVQRQILASVSLFFFHWSVSGE